MNKFTFLLVIFAISVFLSGCDTLFGDNSINGYYYTQDRAYYVSIEDSGYSEGTFDSTTHSHSRDDAGTWTQNGNVLALKSYSVGAVPIYITIEKKSFTYKGKKYIKS